MKLSTNNFLSQIKNLVTGGGGTAADAGFLRDVPIPISSVELGSNVTLISNETNGRVILVDEANDTVFYLTIPVPRDYDEATDTLKLRVLASQLSVSTDDDVELDGQMFIKTAGSALGSDVNPTAPGTVLSTSEQWIEIDFSGNDLSRDDVVNMVLITNGANDTNGEEVLIHAIEVIYRSTLVSYNAEDASNTALR